MKLDFEAWPAASCSKRPWGRSGIFSSTFASAEMVHAPIARVSTGITETGQDHLPAEIKFACPCPRKGENFVIRSDRDEPAVADRDRLRARFLAPINSAFYTVGEGIHRSAVGPARYGQGPVNHGSFVRAWPINSSRSVRSANLPEYRDGVVAERGFVFSVLPKIPILR